MAPLSTDLTKTDAELRIAFMALTTPQKLAELLEVPYSTLCMYLAKKNNYTEFSIKRASGGTRLISTPISPIKIIQRKLARVLSAVYGSRSVVHGFSKGKSIRTNAVRHLGAQWMVSFDLQDFFPSIHFGRVLGFFAGKPYKLPKRVAVALARICCHQASLPVGAPTSPIVANMVCAAMDSKLKALAWSCNCTYTRYADDISISTKAAVLDGKIAAKDALTRRWELGHELTQLLHKSDFKVNPSKTRVRGRHSSLEVTGVRINAGLNTSRKHLRQVRAMLHAWEVYDEDRAETEHFLKFSDKEHFSVYSGLQQLPVKPKFRDVVRGKIEYIGFIRGRDHQVYVKLLQRFQKLTSAKAKPIIIGRATHESVIRQAIWLLENVDASVQGTAFAVQGDFLLTALHNLEQPMWASRPNYSPNRYPVSILWKSDALDVAKLSIQTALPLQFVYGKVGVINLMTDVCVVGFPNHHKKDSVAFRFGKIVQEREYMSIPHFVVDADIVWGNSGGPVIDTQNHVLGVAVKGIAIPGKLGHDDQLSSFVPIYQASIPP